MLIPGLEKLKTVLKNKYIQSENLEKLLVIDEGRELWKIEY